MHARNVSFNKEARAAYLQFCLSFEAKWTANFRDLSVSIDRLATLAVGGRIRVEDVTTEITRLREYWQTSPTHQITIDIHNLLSTDQLEELDLFDKMQLSNVLAVCRQHHSLSSAGRELFSNSRSKKKAANDADRLSKYLHRFGLDWKTIKNS